MLIKSQKGNTSKGPPTSRPANAVANNRTHTTFGVSSNNTPHGIGSQPNLTNVATSNENLGPTQHSASTMSLCNGAVDRSELDSLKSEVQLLRTELVKCKDTIDRLQEREEVMRDRLSEQAIRQLEHSTKFEDLNLGENRPTQLIRRYGNLYTETRLDAFDALDELPEMAEFDELKGKLLFSVIVLAFRSVQHSLQTLKAKLSRLLYLSPSSWQPNCGTDSDGDSSQQDPLVREVQETIALYLRKTVDKYDTSANIKEVCSQVWSTLYDYPSLKECSRLQEYIEEAVRIAWALSVQNPTFVIDFDSKEYKPDRHTRFHSSNPENLEVQSVLWPALLEGEDGPCVFKGVVIT